MPSHLWLIADVLEALADAAAAKAREVRSRRRFNRRRRIGAALHPGTETPLWNELRTVVREATRKRGEQVKLARMLELQPLREVHVHLIRGTRMPDAERTLMLLVWLQAWREGKH